MLRTGLLLGDGCFSCLTSSISAPGTPAAAKWRRGGCGIWPETDSIRIALVWSQAL
jgi:hypothetical protein